jgi:hypothetical protein
MLAMKSPNPVAACHGLRSANCRYRSNIALHLRLEKRVLHRQGRTWAEIGRLVGQRKQSVTADTYTHVLSDGRELDYPALVAELVT